MARGFIGNVGSGCWAFVEARERLDFFKVLSPPVSGTRDYSVPTSSVDSMQAVSETGCRIDSATVNCKMQGGKILRKWAFGAPRHSNP
jgi:hypothetical protein